LLRVALDSGDEGVREAVSLGATIDGRDDDDPCSELVWPSQYPGISFKHTSFRLACHGSVAHLLGREVSQFVSEGSTYDDTDTTTLDELHFDGFGGWLTLVVNQVEIDKCVAKDEPGARREFFRSYHVTELFATTNARPLV